MFPTGLPRGSDAIGEQQCRCEPQFRLDECLQRAGCGHQAPGLLRGEHPGPKQVHGQQAAQRTLWPPKAVELREGRGDAGAPGRRSERGNVW